jgi:hypothetical protein
MHPLLARYLNLEVAVDTLSRADQGQVLKAEERPYAEASSQFPEERSAVLAARGKARPAEATQKSLVRLAAHGALQALSQETPTAEKLQTARGALVEAGSTEAEADAFLAALVLEEGFGDDEDVDAFDITYFLETLDSLPLLSDLTQDRVAGIADAFMRTAPAEWKKPYELAARALLDAAWKEGPEPVNVDHVQQARDEVASQLGKSEVQRANEAVGRFLEFLRKAQLVGPQRQKRLTQRLKTSVPRPS